MGYISRMWIEIAHGLTVLCWVMALFACCQFCFSAGRERAIIAPRQLASICCACLTISLLLLARAYWQSDFTVQNVAENSHTLKPWLYKLTGVWGNHEGSIIFWSWILSVYAAMANRYSGKLELPERQVWLITQMAVLAAFLGFALWTSNPFIRIFPPPAEGSDLNPLLQDPGLAFHPPLLYLGYVGTASLFGLAMAALAVPARAQAILAAMRPWALLVWGFLTAGIALGSYWAYYELGWGGWWFWDPVENASLLPWLLITALLHSLLVNPTGGMRHWSILLAIGSFGLSLIGTFLVRSGILTSVHAFANDPTRGVYLLLILGVLLGAGLIFYARRAAMLSGAWQYRLGSREMGILWNSIALSALCATVFLGTLYPLFLDLAGGPKISVGAPYFNATFVPLAMPLLAVMGVAGLLSAQKTDWRKIRRLLVTIFAASVLGAYALWRYLGELPIFAALLTALALWVLFGTMGSFWRHWRGPMGGRISAISARVWGMHLAHAALAISMLGMVATSYGTYESTLAFTTGQTKNLGDYKIELHAMHQGQRDNYSFVAAELRISDRDGNTVILKPEKRHYASQNTFTTEVDRWVRSSGDFYTALAEYGPAPDQAVLRLAFKPLVSWIWLGALAMALIALAQALRLWRRDPVVIHNASPVHSAQSVWLGWLAMGSASILAYLWLGAPVFIVAQFYAWLG